MPSNSWKAVFCGRRWAGNLSSQREEERLRGLESEDPAREYCGEVSCRGWVAGDDRCFATCRPRLGEDEHDVVAFVGSLGCGCDWRVPRHGQGRLTADS
jgi:hypothetical protein